MTVRHVQTPEDYSEYLADKGLAQAYKQRAEMAKTHNYMALVRKYVEHDRPNSVTPSPSDAPK